MEMFKRLRKRIGCNIVSKRSRKLHRRKKFNNLRNSHKIGIVWAGDRPEDFDSVTRFYHEMQERGIQVDVLCYFPGKVLPDKYTAHRYLNCFKRSDLNFLYIPQPPEVIEFMNTPYEILIDINFRKHFPLYFVTALSVAEFKIGAGGTISNDILDMTIEISQKDKIDYYLEQVKLYLEMINTGI
ncbi:MAG: hypothetical protein R2727_09540 [Bacteroidales bacterium]